MVTIISSRGSFASHLVRDSTKVGGVSIVGTIMLTSPGLNFGFSDIGVGFATESTT
jgi:hypothetical protein